VTQPSRVKIASDQYADVCRQPASLRCLQLAHIAGQVAMRACGPRLAWCRMSPVPSTLFVSLLTLLVTVSTATSRTLTPVGLGPLDASTVAYARIQLPPLSSDALEGTGIAYFFVQWGPGWAPASGQAPRGTPRPGGSFRGGNRARRSISFVSWGGERLSCGIDLLMMCVSRPLQRPYIPNIPNIPNLRPCNTSSRAGTAMYPYMKIPLTTLWRSLRQCAMCPIETSLSAVLILMATTRSAPTPHCNHIVMSVCITIVA
jgi:hypothetical protein